MPNRCQQGLLDIDLEARLAGTLQLNCNRSRWNNGCDRSQRYFTVSKALPRYSRLLIYCFNAIIISGCNGSKVNAIFIFPIWLYQCNNDWYNHIRCTSYSNVISMSSNRCLQRSYLHRFTLPRHATVKSIYIDLRLRAGMLATHRFTIYF